MHLNTLYTLLSICSLGYTQLPPSIFHGTSIVLYPNASSPWPGDSTFVAANFYCYFTPVGYLSFGWWLPAVPGANHSQCDPGNDAFDWYEMTTSMNCSEQGCTTHVVNYNATDSTSAFEDDYVLAALDLGNGKLGQLGLSYFDREYGGYAVGTRRIISETEADQEACRKAITNFKRLQQSNSLELSFQLHDICFTEGQKDTTVHHRQMQMGLTAW